jgi:fatty-acyl-CoA synthase
VTSTRPRSTRPGGSRHLEQPQPRTGRPAAPSSIARAGAEPITAEALRAFCSGKLAHCKMLRYVKIVDEFPMTVTGKIRKVEMRQVSIEELGLQSGAGVRNA